MPGSKSSHRAPRRGRGKAVLSAAALAALVTALVLAVAVIHLFSSSPTRVDASDDQPMSAVDSAAPSASAVTPPRLAARSRDAHRPLQRRTRPDRTSAKPQPVLAGTHFERLTPDQLQRLRRSAEQKASGSTGSTGSTGGELSFSLGTFNLLGSNHTGPHGDDHRSWPSASWRTPQEADYIREHGVDVVGLQEAKPDQLDGLTSRLGWDAFPGRQFDGYTDNSIIYDPAKWEFVSGTHFTIVFMHGPRPETVLRLRDRETGREVYFVNMHTSAGHDGHNTATRHAGMATAVDYINGLKSEGLPIFVTGDMNDRGEFRSRVLGPADLEAAIDGSWSSNGKHYGGGWMAVDWIASTHGVDWSDYWVSEPQARKVSDHYFISADATIPASG